MGKSKWQETVGHGFGTGRLRGTTQRHAVRNEDTGKDAGYHVEHWDGSQDAVARPDTLKVKLMGGMKDG